MAESRICSVDGCGKTIAAHGWCSMHYRRWSKHGDVNARRSLANGEAILEINRLFAVETDDCLYWPHSKDRHGYGQASVEVNGKRRPVGVHVIVCEKRHGPRPSKTHQAAHSCGNGHLSCCNKRHLRWATRSENEQDKTAHGRRIVPANFLKSNAKLSPNEVREIRAHASAYTQTDLAAKYGVSQAAISDIILSKTWNNLD